MKIEDVFKHKLSKQNQSNLDNLDAIDQLDALRIIAEATGQNLDTLKKKLYQIREGLI